MIRSLSIFLVIYYFLGSVFLPQGNFSVLPNLSEMYAHCKATEDKDMDLVDFITDHLVNFDGIFDDHDHGDEQKPHSPLTVNLLKSALDIYFLKFTEYVFVEFLQREIKLNDYLSCFYKSDFKLLIFRPPILYFIFGAKDL